MPARGSWMSGDFLRQLIMLRKFNCLRSSALNSFRISPSSRSRSELYKEPRLADPHLTEVRPLLWKDARLPLESISAKCRPVGPASGVGYLSYTCPGPGPHPESQSQPQPKPGSQCGAPGGCTATDFGGCKSGSWAAGDAGCAPGQAIWLRPGRLWPGRLRRRRTRIWKARLLRRRRIWQTRFWTGRIRRWLRRLLPTTSSTTIFLRLSVIHLMFICDTIRPWLASSC